MNLLTKAFGATAKLTVDISGAGLAIAVSDVEALSSQGAQIVFQPGYVIDKVVSLLGNKSWMVALANAGKAELQSLADKAAAAVAQPAVAPAVEQVAPAAVQGV